ncbi:hypothetical protein [Streptomyces sp. NPDC088736]|uniref:hypothetical protein n=1 Tax=Streptomyces sp. NPDC088736 TaxID=3365881 RepID=UPI0038081086
MQQTSPSDVLACFLFSVSLFAAGLVPWLLLVNAEHLLPRVVREAPAACRAAVDNAGLSLAAALLVLTAPIGATR